MHQCPARLARVARCGVLCLVATTLVIASGASPPSRQVSPVAWWKFDETEGTTASDSSGNKHHGRLTGGLGFATHSVPGALGNALRFEGGDQRVEVSGYKAITGTAPRTISVWIKADKASGQIVSWGTRDFGQMWILGFIRGHVGITPHGGYYYMAARVDDGRWHHVAAVLSEADEPNLHDHVTLYLDGKIAEIDKIGLLDLWPIHTGSEQDVTIGRGFRGAIDDLRIYDRALSEDEIQAIFAQRR